MATRVFQPLPMDMLELKANDPLTMNGVAIVAEANGKQNAMANKNGGIGNIWGVPVYYAILKSTRYTKELLDQSDYFSCCFFDANEKYSKQIMKYLDAATGRKEDKIKELKLHIEHRMEVPYIEEASLIICCKKMVSVPITKDMMTNDKYISQIFSGDMENGSYTLFIGEMLEVMAR